MLARGAEAAAGGKANHRRALGLAAEHVAELAHLVDDLVHAHADEVGEHDFRHRAHAHQGGAGRRADNGRLGNRGVDAAIGAEFLVNTGRTPNTPPTAPTLPLGAPLQPATSSPITNTESSAAIAWCRASLMASRMVFSAMIKSSLPRRS